MSDRPTSDVPVRLMAVIVIAMVGNMVFWSFGLMPLWTVFLLAAMLALVVVVTAGIQRRYGAAVLFGIMAVIFIWQVWVMAEIARTSNLTVVP
jgi:hypothetical protein